MSLFDRLHTPTGVLASIATVIATAMAVWAVFFSDGPSTDDPVVEPLDRKDPFAISRYIISKTEDPDGELLDIPMRVLLPYARYVSSGILEPDDIVLLIAGYCEGQTTDFTIKIIGLSLPDEESLEIWRRLQRASIGLEILTELREAVVADSKCTGDVEGTLFPSSR